MSVIRSLCAAALGLCIAGAQAAIVPTDRGPVQGVQSGEVESFKGIPFARPPLGALRWRPPVAPARWPGVLKADHYGHDCMQLPFPSDAAPLGTAPAEDCLVLNVWRPAASARTPRPVLVWIYGGGFVNGGSSPAVYDGSEFARQGVVFVSFNYRLGRFGFFAHPALSAESGGKGLLGNYGYMDELAALGWVQKNIRAFGGDPAQVTVIGESAGGGSVHMLLTTPLATGLFQRAIIMSGGGRGSLMGPRRLKEDLPGQPSGETVGMNFAASVGIHGSDAAALKRLRALTAEQVVAGMNMASMRPADPARPTYSGPMADGQLAVLAPDAEYARGSFNHATLMVGSTGADIGFSLAKTLDEVYAPFGARRGEAEAAYDPAHTRELARIGREVAMDQTMGEPARHVAQLFTRQHERAYLYRFSYVADSMHKDWPAGAPHATDIPYFFNTVAAKYGAALTPRDAAVGRLAATYVANFAKHGDPNGRDLPPWPALQADAAGIFDFALGGNAGWVNDPWKARLDVAAAVADAR